MKLTLTLLILAALCGCALLDAFVGEETVQARDERGRPLYETPEGEITTLAADPETGALYQPHTITLVKPRVDTDWLNGLGPWGALAGALATIAAGLYARVRNRQRLQTQNRLKQTDSVASFALQLIEQIKEGAAVESNGDGCVKLDAIKQWVREQGSKYENPALLDELLQLANESAAKTR
jgi:hypothetical protein